MVQQKSQSLSICKNSHDSRKLLETHESHNWADRSQRRIQRALQVARSPSGRESFWVLKTWRGKCYKCFSQSLVESLHGGFREGFSGWGQVCLRSYEMNFIYFFYPFPSFAHSLWVKLEGSRYVSHYYRTNPSMTAFNCLRQIFAPPQTKVQSCLD